MKTIGIGYGTAADPKPFVMWLMLKDSFCFMVHTHLFPIRNRKMENDKTYVSFLKVLLKQGEII